MELHPLPASQEFFNWPTVAACNGGRTGTTIALAEWRQLAA